MPPCLLLWIEFQFNTLFDKQRPLLFNTPLAAVPSKSPVGTNDSVTRYIRGKGVFSASVCNGTCRCWMTDLDRNLRVSAHLSLRDGLQRRPNLSLKGCSVHERSLTIAKHLLHPPNHNARKKGKQDHGLDAKTTFCHGAHLTVLCIVFPLHQAVQRQIQTSLSAVKSLPASPVLTTPRGSTSMTLHSSSA